VLITLPVIRATYANQDTKEMLPKVLQMIVRGATDPRRADVTRLARIARRASMADANAKGTLRAQNAIGAARRHMDYVLRTLMDASSVTVAG